MLFVDVLGVRFLVPLWNNLRRGSIRDDRGGDHVRNYLDRPCVITNANVIAYAVQSNAVTFEVCRIYEMGSGHIVGWSKISLSCLVVSCWLVVITVGTYFMQRSPVPGTRVQVVKVFPLRLLRHRNSVICPPYHRSTSFRYSTFTYYYVTTCLQALMYSVMYVRCTCSARNYSTVL